MLKNRIFLLVIAGLAFFLLPAFPRAQTTTVNAEVKLSQTIDDACNLPAPTTFTYTKPSSSVALLDWSAVSGASAYHLKVYELATLSTASETNESGTSKLVANLQPNVAYRCELTAVCPNRETSTNIIIIDIIER